MFGSFTAEMDFAEFKKTQNKDSDGMTSWVRASIDKRLVSLKYVGHEDLSHLSFGQSVVLDCEVGVSIKDYAEVVVRRVSIAG